MPRIRRYNILGNKTNIFGLDDIVCGCISANRILPIGQKNFDTLNL